jgi:hypothetical protein
MLPKNSTHLGQVKRRTHRGSQVRNRSGQMKPFLRGRDPPGSPGSVLACGTMCPIIASYPAGQQSVTITIRRSLQPEAADQFFFSNDEGPKVTFQRTDGAVTGVKLGGTEVPKVLKPH